MVYVLQVGSWNNSLNLSGLSNSMSWNGVGAGGAGGNRTGDGIETTGRSGKYSKSSCHCFLARDNGGAASSMIV